MSRSFTGCKRCKARRQKCDEQRPACGRCSASGAECHYVVQLQWGGRAFSRSRFGICVGSGDMEKLEYSPGEFIYTTKSPDAASSPSLARSVDPFSSLSSERKSLPHHFIKDVPQTTACHPGVQHDICRMLDLMAFQTPSLLHATTALSAIHLRALNNQSESVELAPDIARYMALSLEYFRTELKDSASWDSDELLATARALCLAEIHSGVIHPNSWGPHIEDVNALMAASDHSRQPRPLQSSDGSHWYLDRWHRSIVSLVALTGNGPPISESSERSSFSVVGQLDSPDYLDDYWGFTAHLSAVFRQIGAIAWRNQNNPMEKQLTQDEHSAGDDTAVLESFVRDLIDQATETLPTFYPGVAEGLSVACIHNFMLCNETFQHSALIQIHRRLRGSPASSPAVQQSVKRILECTVQIGSSPGLSSWVILTTPLFIAGCEAQGRDRDTVRGLMSAIHNAIRVPNVLQSLKFLEQYWAHQLDDETWSNFLDRTRSDFIPH